MPISSVIVCWQFSLAPEVVFYTSCRILNWSILILIHKFKSQGFKGRNKPIPPLMVYGIGIWYGNNLSVIQLQVEMPLFFNFENTVDKELSTHAALTGSMKVGLGICNIILSIDQSGNLGKMSLKQKSVDGF